MVLTKKQLEDIIRELSDKHTLLSAIACETQGSTSDSVDFFLEQKTRLDALIDEIRQKHLSIIEYEDIKKFKYSPENHKIIEDVYKRIMAFIATKLETYGIKSKDTTGLFENCKEENIKLYRYYIQSCKKLIQNINRSNSLPDSLDVYKSHKKIMQTNFDKLSVLEESIEKECESIINEHYQASEYNFQLMTDKYYEGLSYIENLVLEKQRFTDQMVNPVKKSEDDKSEHKNVVVPDLPLPEFHGDPAEWISFESVFYDRIASSDKFSDKYKLMYLTNQLKGDAAAFLGSVRVGQSDFWKAWERVKENYTNRRQILDRMSDVLFEQPMVRPGSSTDLFKFVNITRTTLVDIKSMDIDWEPFEPIIVRQLIKKLDIQTRKDFEVALENGREPIPLETLFNFVIKKANAYLVDKNEKKPTVKQLICYNCKGDHQIYKCDQFLRLPVMKRGNLIKDKKLCTVCLRPQHGECNFMKCLVCGGKHNTVLHADSFSNNNNNKKTEQKPVNKNSASHNTIQNDSQKFVFLGTAYVNVKNSEGRYVKCRALLDPGSQINIVAKELVDKLGFKPKNKGFKITGIGGRSVCSSQRISLSLSSTKTNYKAQTEARVLPKITDYLPKEQKIIFDKQLESKLADPDYFHPKSIELLLGGAIWAEIVQPQIIRFGKDKPILQKSKFGLVLIGPNQHINKNSGCCGVTTYEEFVDSNIQKLWELDKVIHEKSPLTTEEILAENHFDQTTYKNEENRFVVRLAKKDVTLGTSYEIARRRFYFLEKRFQRDPKYQEAYTKNIREWIDLNHAEVIKQSELENKEHYFLPHHGVIKESSTTTKLRVVFDASAKTSNNIALNEVLIKGPSIQDELYDILLRFRLPTYVMSADIEKMYRQILVHTDDQLYQLIIWREKPSDALQIIKLKTVIFGTASAPYLATKCLQTVGKEVAKEEPELSKIILKDFYMDDLITGFDSLEEAKEFQMKIKMLLAAYGFNLRKWCVNHAELIKNVPTEDVETQWDFSDNDQKVKTLGLNWDTRTDRFNICFSSVSKLKITKRIISSEAGQIFDPLGLISPIVVVAKLILQELWRLKVDWDHPIPNRIIEQWVKFREQIRKLEFLSIQRQVLIKDSIAIELHGFSDASEKAYGAAIYLRSVDKEGKTEVHLLTSKSKVAPTKQVTLARLELCAAKLLAELVHKVKRTINYNIDKTYLWTDSTITLYWIKRPSKSFKTFVANRVSDIQEFSDALEWYHVPGELNPADLISRGMWPEELVSSNLWFNGPSFLQLNQENWPKQDIADHDHKENSEIRKEVCYVTTLEQKVNFLETINNRNSFDSLVKIIAFVSRFITNCRLKKVNRNLEKKIVTIEMVPTLTVKELQESKNYIFKILQKFSKINENIKDYQNLSPFMDKNGLVRVGGRLENANIPFELKHQILLPNSSISKLIFLKIHLENMHAGPQTLLNISRKEYWILNGKKLANSVFKNCIRCCKIKPKNIFQLMGNLPANRVNISAPFTYTGVDYAGPIIVHYTVRGKKPTKAYLAVFVCFTTKAVHLEVISDLTTKAFIGGLRRFISRRGTPIEIISDNATNFVGAREELKALKEFLAKENKNVTNWSANKGIKWLNIPARSPHFGGLWESAVKRAKFHLKELINSNSLTYEELITCVSEVEVILNSRPLTPISDNPSDLSALTPMNFLIQGSFSPLEENNFRDKKIGILNRWEIVNKIRQHFWDRWSKEYLHTLQQKSKWCKVKNNIKINDLVLLNDENTPSIQWRLGRILETIPGKDGLVRVVKVRTSTGEVLRAITRLSPLPDLSEDWVNKK